MLMLATKRVLLLSLIAAAVMLLFASTREWMHVDLVEGAATVTQLRITGQVTATGVMPIALALLAVGVTLTIAGRVMRTLLAALVALLGVWIVLTSFTAARGEESDLVALAGAELSQVTGLGASEHMSAVARVSVTPWPLVTVGLGALTVLIGIAIVVWGRNWKTAGRKYESTARRSGTPNGSVADRISDWDSLSDGDDPSEEESVNPADKNSPGVSSSDS